MADRDRRCTLRVSSLGKVIGGHHGDPEHSKKTASHRQRLSLFQSGDWVLDDQDLADIGRLGTEADTGPIMAIRVGKKGIPNLSLPQYLPVERVERSKGELYLSTLQSPHRKSSGAGGPSAYPTIAHF